jgi:hypothetical protein
MVMFWHKLDDTSYIACWRGLEIVTYRYMLTPSGRFGPWEWEISDDTLRDDSLGLVDTSNDDMSGGYTTSEQAMRAASKRANEYLKKFYGAVSS